MSLNNDYQSDLQLLAFRYVAAEMSVEEAQEFELRLADEQDVREAVATAVQIAQAVAYSEPKTVSRRSSVTDAARLRSRKGRLWLVVASSVAVAFLAGIGISRWLEWPASSSQPVVTSRDDQAPASNPEPPRTSPVNGRAIQVVELWSASAEEFDAFNGETTLVESDEAVMASAAQDVWEASDEDEGAFNVPSWMLAAVSPDDETEESPFDSMPEEN